MAKNNEPFILLTEYKNLYTAKYNRQPKLNLYREKWAMQSVIDSVGFARAGELLRYYFKTAKSGHPLLFFYNNFDRMDTFMESSEKDKEARKKLMQKTKEMVEGNEY